MKHFHLPETCEAHRAYSPESIFFSRKSLGTAAGAENLSIMSESGEPAELVDPAVEIKEKCGATKECAALKEKLNTCNERVSSKSATTETCVEELSDYLHCVDHCLAHQLFKHLK